MIFNKLSIASVDYIMYTGLIVIVFYIGFWGYKQGRIFTLQTDNYYPLSERHSKSLLNADKTDLENSKEGSLKLIKGKLEELMELEKPFLNANLTLFDLSNAVNVSSREVSNCLNREMKMNFYEFINRYRVSEVKTRLETDGDKFTILAIALDCGFNSKASFNRIFKQITGFTPSEYRSHIQINANQPEC